MGYVQKIAGFQGAVNSEHIVFSDRWFSALSESKAIFRVRPSDLLSPVYDDGMMMMTTMMITKTETIMSANQGPDCCQGS